MLGRHAVFPIRLVRLSFPQPNAQPGEGPYSGGVE